MATNRSASLNVPVPAAPTAFKESAHIDLDVDISASGEHFVNVWARGTGAYTTRLILRFDMYEWERFKRAMAKVDEVFEQVAQGGITFKVGRLVDSQKQSPG